MSQRIARSQATIHTQTDSYTITQTVGEYIFTTNSDGKIPSQVTFASTVKVALGGDDISTFTIGAITRPAGFAAITVNSTAKTISYQVNANTTNLADSGTITIPIIIDGTTYNLSFAWSKAKQGVQGLSVPQILPGWIEEWDSGKTQLNNNYVITPKLFAGTKQSDDTISGIALGQFATQTRNSAGTVITETLNGIYGFNQGYKTFAIDSNGNVELGRGDQLVRYNVSTGKIEFGAAVALQWVGATYINSSGIFTGTLSADTVNAIQIDASQISAGTINATRIDVASLKTQLITAANINALTLTVVRGTIGGWTIDSDSISRGTKNNTAGAFTSASGSITLGSNGLRGYKWRFDSTGAGAIAGGNISWDASGNVTFASSVSVSWTTGIDGLTTALGGSSYPKMTNINSSGVYTGTLTAAQVNAVAINATSISAGTLNVARIAAGSITVDKLNVANVQAGIVTAAIINGLTLTFDKGVIGGWTIGADTISYGSLGVIGDTPIQIRSSTAGSGDIYTGALKLYGVTLTWRQSSNAGHLVFGQVASSRSTIKTGFCGIQMMAWDGTEYFCLSTNTQKSGAKEVYNRIAGWTFDNQNIWKNSVYLGSDGSIYNGSQWRLNNDGSGQVANGNISWNASGVVTFASSVSVNWTNGINGITTALGGASYSKLTYINSSGVYTGTLTATQVNAVAIDATKITAGTLSVARIAASSITVDKLNVANVQAGIVTAAVVNGLTLAFNKGTIGGWTIDADSIFRGTKNNTASAFTLVSGSITFGSNGLRGFKWRFDSTGAGAIAGGNISWDASGNVTFASSVSLNWTNAANTALSSANTYTDTKSQQAITTAATDATTKADAAKELARAMAYGRMLYRDPTFHKGNNSLNVYNNSGNGTVTHTRVSNSTAPNDSKYVIQIKNAGTSSPGCGGFFFATAAQYRKVFITRIIARIPSGRSIVFATNNVGTGGAHKWLTPTAGTGDWQEYIHKVTCGTASFDTTNFFYIDGAVGSTSSPVEWNLAYVTVFDVTSSEMLTTTIDANGIYTGTLTATQVNAVAINASSISTGTLNVARIAASSITVDKLNVANVQAGIVTAAIVNGLTLAFNKGTIGGWTINATQIYSGNVVLNSNGSVTNSTKWKLNSDGSGLLASNNISWDAAGVMNIQNARIKDVVIAGTQRSPFVQFDSSISVTIGGSGHIIDKSAVEKYDNLCVIAGTDSGGWSLVQPQLPWNVEQSGRRLCLIHYRYGNQIVSGSSTMTAPSGKYFYEDGLQSTTLVMSRELVELIGYGDGSTFYGWVVLNRRDLVTTSRYGRSMQYLAMGYITVSSSSSYSMRYKTYDGGGMSMSRTGTGLYNIYLPWSLGTDKYMVMTTGRWLTGPVYGTIKAQYSSYFTVQTSDDSTANEGSFNFVIISTADFK